MKHKNKYTPKTGYNAHSAQHIILLYSFGQFILFLRVVTKTVAIFKDFCDFLPLSLQRKTNFMCESAECTMYVLL